MNELDWYEPQIRHIINMMIRLDTTPSDDDSLKSSSDLDDMDDMNERATNGLSESDYDF